MGKNRGARVEEKAKAICFQRRRDITGVQAQMQHKDAQMVSKHFRTKGLNTLVTLTLPLSLVTFQL
jgi:hypothetical protein